MSGCKQFGECFLFVVGLFSMEHVHRHRIAFICVKGISVGIFFVPTGVPFFGLSHAST